MGRATSGPRRWCGSISTRHFGDIPAAKFPYEATEAYIQQRRDSNAANATINRELALLHRAFVLGKEAGKIAAMPKLPKRLKENNVRKGFFERDDFLAVRAALPDEIKPIVTFAYWTGCRKGEILGLKWSQVDLIEKVVRLEPGETKNDQPRIVPMVEELHQMLAMQKAIRDQKWPECASVFFWNGTGQPVKWFYDSWRKACKEVGLVNAEGNANKMFHDLRRTGVRNLVRAGVPERVAMMISGHRTRSVFDRYNIVSESDLREAARKLNVYIEGQAARPEISEAKHNSDKMVTMAGEDVPRRLPRIV